MLIPKPLRNHFLASPGVLLRLLLAAVTTLLPSAAASCTQSQLSTISDVLSQVYSLADHALKVELSDPEFYTYFDYAIKDQTLLKSAYKHWYEEFVNGGKKISQERADNLFGPPDSVPPKPVPTFGPGDEIFPGGGLQANSEAIRKERAGPLGPGFARLSKNDFEDAQGAYKQVMYRYAHLKGLLKDEGDIKAVCVSSQEVQCSYVPVYNDDDWSTRHSSKVLTLKFCPKFFDIQSNPTAPVPPMAFYPRNPKKVPAMKQNDMCGPEYSEHLQEWSGLDPATGYDQYVALPLMKAVMRSHVYGLASPLLPLADCFNGSWYSQLAGKDAIWKDDSGRYRSVALNNVDNYVWMALSKYMKDICEGAVELYYQKDIPPWSSRHKNSVGFYDEYTNGKIGDGSKTLHDLCVAEVPAVKKQLPDQYFLYYDEKGAAAGKERLGKSWWQKFSDLF